MLPGVVNVTPFCVDVTSCLDAYANQSYLVVVSASFEARPGEFLHVADEQQPVNDVDVHFGAPGESSVRYDSDVACEKRFFDVIVNGVACAPGGRPVGELEVGVRFDRFNKILLVSGDRMWRRTGLGLTPSSPERFTRMPIVYERTFGGCHGDACDRRNPVGVGFGGALSRDSEVRSEVPNIELPHERLLSRGEQAEPAGFGAIARSWMPRLPLAGTYDEQWKLEQFPLMPRDFDSRFYQAAPLDQQFERSLEGEVLHTAYLTPEGHWSCRVPRLRVPVRLRHGSRAVEASLRTDTVILEPDVYRCTLKARTRIRVRRSECPLEEVVVGDASRAWWRARRTGKAYVARPGSQAASTSYFDV